MFPRIQNKTLRKECIGVKIRGAVLAKKGAPKLSFHREGGKLLQPGTGCGEIYHKPRHFLSQVVKVAVFVNLFYFEWINLASIILYKKRQIEDKLKRNKYIKFDIGATRKRNFA